MGKWDRDVGTLSDEYDLSIIDGTFSTGDELTDRNMSDVPHPTVQHTMRLIGNGRNRVFFTHLNHTNPLISSPKPGKPCVPPALMWSTMGSGFRSDSSFIVDPKEIKTVAIDK